MQLMRSISFRSPSNGIRSRIATTKAGVLNKVAAANDIDFIPESLSNGFRSRIATTEAGALNKGVIEESLSGNMDFVNPKFIGRAHVEGIVQISNKERYGEPVRQTRAIETP